MNNETSIKLMFIAHGGQECGMGHVIRSLSLASAFKKNGCMIRFISKYAEGIETIHENGFYVYDYNVLQEAINDYAPDIIVIDTYQISNDLFVKLREQAFTVYIDDIYSMEYPVDVILNGNITGLDMGYKQVFPEQQHLLGIKYNLIRNEFHNIPSRVINRDVKHIMITTGASDPADMTYRFLTWLFKDEYFKNFTYNVVVGSSFIHKDKIIEFAEAHPSVNCFINPSNMSEIMLNSDIAVSAGGSTLYELAACGTPALAFIYAENQRTVVEYMSGEHIINLGYYENINCSEWLEALKKIIMDYEYRRNISVKMQKLVDGKGAGRTADKILEFYAVNSR